MDRIAALCVFVSVIVASVSGANVLFLSPITAPSHSNFFKPIVKELARRGHHVTYWNGLRPEANGPANLRQLYSERLAPFNEDHQIGFRDRGKQFLLFVQFPMRLVNYCQAIYQDPIFHQLMTTGETFDVILVEGVLNECVLPLVQVLKAPFIYLNGIAPTPWLLDAVGSPQGFDVYPNPGFSFTDSMNLWERTLNTVSSLFGVYYRHWVVTATVDYIAGRVLGWANLTSVREIEHKQLSLIITNTHFSINYQLPTLSSVIQAGGLHCAPSKPLPKDLEEFVQGAGDAGFIIVSFGSILRGAEMPESTRHLFLSVFARLEQHVLWKWEDDRRNGTLPPNVRLLKWLPQQDLLGHPKARLFITHGGLFSNQEAVYHGVPLVALPVFADQPINAQKVHNDGYGIRLDWDTLDEDSLYEAIEQVINNPKYAEKVRHLSSLMRDQSEHPLDRAVYWIEYVVRHKGAPHLRTASRELASFQRGLVDVMGVILVTVLACVYLTVSLIKYLRRRKRSNQLDVSAKKKQ